MGAQKIPPIGMTPLAEILLRRIAATGPITIADYMAECLLHPEYGYYSTRDPFGAGGDFTTAPEISQMFGELIGLCLAQTWLDQDQPAAFTLAELGPGRGTLMADILRATGQVPGFLQAANLCLVEASVTLREKQRETLGAYQVNWLDRVNDLPDAPLYLVANEFFDALPIRQFTRDEKGWREHQITEQGGSLQIGLSAPAPIAALDHRLNDTKPGDIVEICAPGVAIVGSLSTRINDHGGVAIIVDYGGWHSLGDTLQALRNHKMENPLANPGNADITAHVDFEALASAATDISTSQTTPQGVLLERLGITARARQLAENLQGDALDSHVAAHRRLTHGDEMGTLFKAIAFYPNGINPPPGFSP